MNNRNNNNNSKLANQFADASRAGAGVRKQKFDINEEFSKLGFDESAYNHPELKISAEQIDYIKH